MRMGAGIKQIRRLVERGLRQAPLWPGGVGASLQEPLPPGWLSILLRGRGVFRVPRLEDLARDRAAGRFASQAGGGWSAEEVGAFRKNSREAVVVRLLSRGDRLLVDVREFYWASAAGEYRPSRGGVAVDVSLLPDLIALLAEARARLSPS